MRTMMTMAAILAACAGAAAAQTPAPKLEGAYLFHTFARKDGRPVCSELWDFAADGTMRVESGRERVKKRFRTEADRTGAWLVGQVVETNGEPDCTGAVTTRVPPGEQRLYLVPMNDGTIQTCPPPQLVAGGAPYVSGCFGAIVRAADAG